MKKYKYIKLYSYLLLSSYLLHNCYQDDYIKITREFEEAKKEDDLSLSEIEQMYYKYFDSYKVKYNHYIGLSTDSDVRDLKRLIDSKTTCDYVFTGTSYDMLELIKNNTNQYIEKNSLDDYGYINVLDYDSDLLYEYSDVLEGLEYTLKIEIEKLINKKFNNDTMEDLCKMRKLAILVDPYNKKYNKDGSNVYADYVDNENRIVIYLDPILKGKEISKAKDQYFKVNTTLIHEIDHMRQYICDDRKEKGQLNNKIDYSRSSNISAIVESSAESAVYNETNSIFNGALVSNEEKCYYYERAFENQLLLLSLTNNDTSLDDYYASIFDTDILELLSYFDIKTDEEIKSFLNILKQKDASLLRNNIVFSVSPIRTLFADLTSSEARDIMGINWKVEILRLSLRNLVEYNMIQSEKLTKEEMLALGGILFFVSCDGSYTTNYKPDESFINQIVTLEAEFYNYLSDEYDLDSNKSYITTQYATFSDILTNSFSSELANNLTTKFPKLNKVVQGVTDNGYSYFEIEKNKCDGEKSLIYTK